MSISVTETERNGQLVSALHEMGFRQNGTLESTNERQLHLDLGGSLPGYPPWFDVKQ
jgi:hypothetical protein